MQNHHRTHRRNSVWGLLFSLILLLSLAGCGGAGRQEPQDETPPVVEPDGDETPPSPFAGDKEIKIGVEENVVDIHGYPSDNVTRLNYQDIAEKLPAVLDGINWEEITWVSVYLWADEAVQQSVIDMVPALLAEGCSVDVHKCAISWPERLSGERMTFDLGDLRTMWTESYPRVTDLSVIWYCENVTVAAFRDRFPNLQALRIITGNMNGWDLVMPGVESAVLGNCEGLTFEMLATCFPNLKELQLSYALFPEDLEQISRMGIESLHFSIVDPQKMAEWADLEDRYSSYDTYDLSVDADREALCALLPYSAQQIKTCCLDRGMEVFFTLRETSIKSSLPDPLELSPGP